jgi:hypothetical protein
MTTIGFVFVLVLAIYLVLYLRIWNTFTDSYGCGQPWTARAFEIPIRLEPA